MIKRILFLTAFVLSLFTLPTLSIGQDTQAIFIGKWVGKSSWTEGSSFYEEDLEVVFHSEGNPPTVKMITHKWGLDSNRKATKFEFSGSGVKFWIDSMDHPKSRKRFYELRLEGKSLKGTLSGINRSGTGEFSNEVLLKKIE